MPQDDVILTFPKGLPGFAGLTQWRLDEPRDSYPLKFLQSVERPEISMSCMDAAAVKADYRVPLGDAEAQLLGLEKESDALVLVLVVVPEDPKGMTADLAGPLVINTAKRIGVQAILDTRAYPLQYPVLVGTGDVIVSFPAGLVGFPLHTRFRLFEPKGGYPLKFLQSVEQEDLSFVAIDVAAIKPDYAFDLAPEDAAFLDLAKPEEALVLALVVVPEDPRQMTANLAGPLVVNTRTRQGRQVILNTERYPLRFPILDPAR